MFVSWPQHLYHSTSFLMPLRSLHTSPGERKQGERYGNIGAPCESFPHDRTLDGPHSPGPIIYLSTSDPKNDSNTNVKDSRSEHSMQAVTIAHFKAAELQDQEHVRDS